MNTFQTTLAYTIAALTLTAFLWACARALRKRFAGEPCYSPPSKRVCVQCAGEPHLPDCRCSPPSEEDRRPIMEQLEQRQAAAFPAYIKALPDADLWAMKGLSAPLAKIRKTEMDVRRRRRARATKAPGRLRTLHGAVHHAEGWDANGSPAIDDNSQAALAE